MKAILPIAVVLIIVTIGIFAYSSTQNPQSSDSMLPKESGMDAIVGEDKTMTKESSRYLIYTKANLDNAKSTRRVLFFYANWCSTCRPADASFSQNQSKIPTDITLFRVNYNDTETDQEEK